MLRREARYLHLADIEDGVSGFKKERSDKRCWRPWYKYIHGGGNSWSFCQTKNPIQMDNLARKVGAMTRKEFMDYRNSQNKSNWLNAYGEHLSVYVGRALENGGIDITIDGTDVHFYCPKGMFIEWRGRHY